MTVLFPNAVPCDLGPGLETVAYSLSMGTLLCSKIAPGAILPLHHHREAQLGLCLKGSFAMKLNGHAATLTALRQVYCVAPDQPHGATNPGLTSALGLDFKSAVATPVTGLFDFDSEFEATRTSRAAHVVGPWFDIRCQGLIEGEQRRIKSTRASMLGFVGGGEFLVRIDGAQRAVGPFSTFCVPSPDTPAELTCECAGWLLTLAIDGAAGAVRREVA